MENLAILETEEIYRVNGWGVIPLLIGAFLIAFGLALTKYERCVLWGILCTIGSVVLLFFGLRMIGEGIPTGTYKYAVYVEDAQTAMEINENYKVLRKNGCIWEITDTTDEERLRESSNSVERR